MELETQRGSGALPLTQQTRPTDNLLYIDLRTSLFLKLGASQPLVLFSKMWTWLLIYCIVLLASYVLLKNYRERHLDSENGCEAPKRYPQLDFLLGLDLLIQTGKMMVENRFFPVTLERYSALGNTFKAKMPGITLINSIEPDNIQSVFATNAGNWGVSWRQPGFVEYCGRGFLNTDGEEWQAARVMLNPSFNKTNIWDHHIYEHHLSLMIQRIPKDGSTVDLQQLVDMLVRTILKRPVLGLHPWNDTFVLMSRWIVS